LQRSGNSCTLHLISMLVSSAFLFSSHMPTKTCVKQPHRSIPDYVGMLYMLSILHASVMPQTKAMVSIENVVASASINQRVDLNLITKNFVDVEYHPDRFPGLVFRLKNPKTTTLIFSSGKMVCTGARSEDQSRKAVQEVVRRLRKGGIPIKNEAEVVIQNIVASVTLGGKIRLEEAARVLPKSMYEPEQFPGLIHRMADPKTVILLFTSGKLVCTGAKKEGDVYRAVNNLHVMLEEKGLMTY
jgi:transcription initiation factor TFIID TATA-box-binding protein